MVQEVRDIFLSMDEVKDAFSCYQRIAPDFLPRGAIISCQLVGESVSLTVDMTYGGTTQRNDLVFKGIDVLKPLIRYCIENNIMLPRDGQKSLQYKGDKISLHVELNLGVDLPASVNPLQMKDAQNPKIDNSGGAMVRRA